MNERRVAATTSATYATKSIIWLEKFSYSPTHQRFYLQRKRH